MVDMRVIGQGMHVHLSVSVRGTPGSAQVPPDARACQTNLMCVFALPAGCFADLDELSRRHKGFGPGPVRLHAYSASTNPELIAEDTTAEALGVEFLGVALWGASAALADDMRQQRTHTPTPTTEVQQPTSGDPNPNLNPPPALLSFTLPVHLRYHRAVSHRAAADYARVTIPPPRIFLCTICASDPNPLPYPPYRYSGEASPQQCSYHPIVTAQSETLLAGCRPAAMQAHQGAPQSTQQFQAGAVELPVPLGNLDVRHMVAGITWAVVTCTTLLLCATMLC